jgi:hypothetical protein
MKKKYFILFFPVLAGFLSNAQSSILGMHVSPQNPTTADMIYLVADVSFTSGPCNQKTTNFSQNGNTFYAFALHCIGPLSVICNETDSFPAGVLPAGNYQFTFSVDAGFGGPPCNPGIVPGPSNTISFTVTAVTGIQETRDHNILFTLSDNILFIKPPSDLNADKSQVYIYSTSGQQVIISDVTGENSLDLSGLAPGIYTALYISGSERSDFRFVIDK